LGLINARPSHADACPRRDSRLLGGNNSSFSRTHIGISDIKPRLTSVQACGRYKSFIRKSLIALKLTPRIIHVCAGLR
jgi:hypothetical protein